MISAYSLVMANRMWNDPDGTTRLIQRHNATIAWIRDSCKADNMPAWLIDLVTEQSRWQMIDPLYPLIEEETTQP